MEPDVFVARAVVRWFETRLSTVLYCISCVVRIVIVRLTTYCAEYVLPDQYKLERQPQPQLDQIDSNGLAACFGLVIIKATTIFLAKRALPEMDTVLPDCYLI